MLRILAAALLAFTATAANAGTTRSSVDVAFGDLNLSRPADAKVLATRLEAAAELVCRDAGDGQFGLTAQHAMRECMSNAINVALSRIAAAQTNAVRANLISDREAMASN